MQDFKKTKASALSLTEPAGANRNPHGQRYASMHMPCCNSLGRRVLNEEDSRQPSACAKSCGVRACKRGWGHMPVDAMAVLEHAVVGDGSAEHGVPGPPLQQQLLPPNVDHARHMLVPASQYTSWSDLA